MAAVTSKVIKTIGNGVFTAYSSGTTSIAVVIASTVTWELRDVRFNLTTGPGEGSTFLVTILTSGSSTPHTYRASSQNINTLRFHRYAPNPPLILAANEHAKITWTDKTTEAWGLSVNYVKRQ